MKSRSISWVNAFILSSGVIMFFSVLVYAQTPINCGQVISDSISPAGQQDSYTFGGSAGDVVTIRVRQISGSLTPQIDLYDPSETLIGSGSGAYEAKLDKTLAATGSHRIVVRDSTNNKTGNYNVTWQKVANACSATALNCGQVVIGGAKGVRP